MGQVVEMRSMMIRAETEELITQFDIDEEKN